MISPPSPQRPALREAETFGDPPQDVPDLELYPSKADFAALQKRVDELEQLVYAALGSTS